MISATSILTCFHPTIRPIIKFLLFAGKHVFALVLVPTGVQILAPSTSNTVTYTYTICDVGCGAVMARHGLLTPADAKVIAGLILNYTLPALLFAKMVTCVSPDNVDELG
jgi:hypothetical protein